MAPLIILVLLACILNSGYSNAASPHLHLHRQGERVEDGAFIPRDDSHYKDGYHHSEFDHEAILGSVKDAEEFDHLEPEEAKRRLGILLKQMDFNKDEYISRNELHAWILRSFRMLSEEESEERFEDADENEDGKVTWAEYVADSYGMNKSEDEDDDDDDEEQANDNKVSKIDEDSKLVKDDKEMFEAADLDHSGYLDKKEFLMFTHPEEHPKMLDIILKQTLNDKDTNNNGVIDFQEFVGERAADEDKEWLLAEKEKFDNEFDKDGDGSLNSHEILSWVIPSNSEIAEDEVTHLFAASDDDHDDRLSFREVLDHHDIFVGSEATDFGDQLHNIHTFKDEL